MGRLTEKDDQGNWCIRGLPWKNLYPGIAITENTYERIYAVAKKLLDYEDTGLTPDQIWQMDALYTEKCREVAELRERDTAKEPAAVKRPEWKDRMLHTFLGGHHDR